MPFSLKSNSRKRKGSKKSSRRFSRGFETLESRRLLAGDALMISFDVASISEDGGVALATVTRPDTNGALGVTLTSHDLSEATVPTSVIIPNGSDSATFEVTAVNDSLADGTRAVRISAAGGTFDAGSAILQVTDHSVLDLTLSASTVEENASTGEVTATITRGFVPSANRLLVTHDNVLSEYSFEGGFGGARAIPFDGLGRDLSDVARDVTVLSDGTVAVYDGTFEPILNTLDPVSGIWNHTDSDIFSTANNLSYGGIASFEQYVFVTDMSTGGSPDHGIWRFDLATGEAVRFAETLFNGVFDGDIEYIDLTIGLDGLLYALGQDFTTIGVFNPTTLAEQRRIRTAELIRAISVDSSGDIFAITFGGDLHHFDSDGLAINSRAVGITNLTDVDINSDGVIAIGTTTGRVALSDRELSAVSSFSIGLGTTFVTFGAPSAGSGPQVTLTSDSPRISIPNTVTLSESTITVPLETVDNQIVDGSETVTITATSAFGTASDTIEVTDDDTAIVSLSASSQQLDEGGSITLTATTTNASSRDILVSLSTSGSASDADLTLPSDTIRIPAGQLSGSITITSPENTTYEPPRDATITIASIVGATEGANDSISLQILENDPEPTISLSLSEAVIGEPAGSSTLSATLSNPSSEPVTVSLSFGGTASASDFQVAENTITIAAGELSGTLQLLATDDPTVEDNESILISVDSVTNDFEFAPAELSLLVQSNDVANIEVTASESPVQVSEDASSAVLQVKLSTQPESNVTLSVTSSDPGEVLPEVSSLVFTPENWNVTQGLTVVGQGDLESDGDIEATITISVDPSASPASYDADAKTQLVVNADRSFSEFEVDVVDGVPVIRDPQSGSVLFAGEQLPTTPLLFDLSSETGSLAFGDGTGLAGVVRVVNQDDDVVSFAGKWIARRTFIGDEFTHVIQQDGLSVEVVNDRPHENPVLAQDTNGDGLVTPLDALVGINELNRQGSRDLIDPIAGDFSPFYFDVNGDSRIQPIDSLIVLNFLNGQPAESELPLAGFSIESFNEADDDEEAIEWLEDYLRSL